MDFHQIEFCDGRFSSVGRRQTASLQWSVHSVTGKFSKIVFFFIQHHFRVSSRRAELTLFFKCI